MNKEYSESTYPMDELDIAEASWKKAREEEEQEFARLEAEIEASALEYLKAMEELEPTEQEIAQWEDEVISSFLTQVAAAAEETEKLSEALGEQMERDYLEWIANQKEKPES